MIGKIEKAKRYAQERNRIHFQDLTVTFNAREQPPHGSITSQANGSATGIFFQTRGRCSHTMALEMILEGMVVSEPMAGADHRYSNSHATNPASGGESV